MPQPIHVPSPEKRQHHDAATTTAKKTTWLQDTIAKVQKEPKEPLDPTIVALQQLIAQDASLHQLCYSMFAEASHLGDPTYLPIDRVLVVMRLFNSILPHAPEWLDLDASYNLVGLPFNMVLMTLMATPSGQRLFRRQDVNRHLKAILNKWAAFLETSESRYALNSTDGWLSPPALAKLEDAANRATPGQSRSFTALYECPDEKDPNTMGFASWDAFFTRRFKPGIRPLPPPEVLDGRNGAPIINACESKPWRISRRCSRHDLFWLKGQPFSIMDMLDNDPFAERFVGGTVYQAYLSALSYHRWHAPVSGTIKRIRYVDGSYFAHMPMSDPLAMEKSQGYLAAAATRALVFIEASDPRIGLICLVTIGMGEVSSCDATVHEGEFVEAGDEIGSFHYGGSTHCLVFSRSVDVRLQQQVGDEKGNPSSNIPVKALLARCFLKEKSHL